MSSMMSFPRLSIVFMLVLCSLSIAKPTWTGTWETNWRSGSARLILKQDEKGRVTGTYPSHQGTVEAEVRGPLLEGFWKEPTQTGSFLFAMSPDGSTFSGRFESGEWWNGRRVRDEEGFREEHIFQRPQLDSPRNTVRSFIIAFEYLQDGDSRFVSTVTQCVRKDGEVEVPVDELMDHLEALFQVIDHTTFRIWKIPSLGSAGFDPRETRDVTIPLTQAGTGVTFHLQVKRYGSAESPHWQIILPPLEELKARNQEFLRARGRTRSDPLRWKKLQSPRATLKAFLAASKAEDDEERDLLQRTMDLRQFHTGTLKQEVALATEYLKNIIDRAGYIIWQEIPDDPESNTPYLHFDHPVGKVVLAPVPEDGGGITWKFTQETMAGLPALYEAVELLPRVAGVPPATRQPLYFQVRELIHALSPWWLLHSLILENWQWPGMILVLALGWALARLLTFLSSLLLHWRFSESNVHLKSTLEKRFLKPLFLTFLALTWLYGIDVLGLPDQILGLLQLLARILLVVGAGWACYNFIDILGLFFMRKARQDKSILDDILVSLVSSLFKLFVIVSSFVMLAETLSLPYRTVVAGLGIGGLAIAIAAKDTLANFFGSAVLLADRPFRRGDLVEVGSITGTISKVGLRSTHIRTLEDSLVIIPNNVLANEQINNLKKRRRRHVRCFLSVVYETPPELLDQFRDRLYELIAEQPEGETLERHVGVWQFASSSIDLEIFCYVNAANRREEYEKRHDLLVGIVRLAEEMGIGFAFPTQTLHLMGSKLGEPVGLTLERAEAR